MDFKRNSLSFLCASLIFTCAAFTNYSPSTLSKNDKKNDRKLERKTNKKAENRAGNRAEKNTKRKAHTLIISPTQLHSASSISSNSLIATSSLNCFQTPLDFLPTFNFLVVKDTLTETPSDNLVVLEDIKNNNEQDNELDFLALLDQEATQKTNQGDFETDLLENFEIDFSTPNNLTITPQLLEKITLRENFTASLVDLAVAQEGVPYVHGGKSPKGFDCSGFVSYVFSKFKINLPASSSSYDNVGKKIKLEDAQVGDVICFTGRNSRSGRTGHVGIIVENNPNEPIKFIHAASGNRRQITYSTMESSYYQPRFRSVRRISVPAFDEVLTTQDAQ